MSNKLTIDVETKTLIRFWLVLIGIGLVILFLYKAATGLIIVGISIFLALALKPLVKKVNKFLEKHLGTKKKHRTASAVLAYLIIVLALGIVIAVVGPVVVNETAKFIQQVPEAFNNSLGGWEGINRFGNRLGIENLQNELSIAVKTVSENIFNNFGGTVVASVSSVADALTKIVLVLILTLLFLLEGPNIMNTFWSKLGARKEDKKPVEVARSVTSKMANVVSTYVSRQIFVAVIDGCATAVITFILSFIFKFSASLAIPMGMITMVFYMIPMFGQFIGAALVTIVLLFSNPIAAITFAIVYVVYTQIENNVIAPRIQGSALNLPAIAILCAMIIGMYMFGLLGAIVAIPIAGCIRVFIDEYPNIKSARE